MSRPHRTLFGVLPLPLVQEDTVTSRVLLSRAAVDLLHGQLTAPGDWRSGQLSGHLDGDALHVTRAALGGSPVWHPRALSSEDRPQPWSLEAPCTRDASQGWCGHWVMLPDDTLPTAAQAGWWLRRGAGPGFLESRSVLLEAGLFDEQFTVAAWQVIHGHQSGLAVTW